MAALNAAGNKLPHSDRKGQNGWMLGWIQSPPEVWDLTWQSGWATTKVMYRYLSLLREHVDPTGPLAVVRGMVSTHQTATTKAAAEALGIQFLFLPPAVQTIPG
jgi:hypothetical protein